MAEDVTRVELGGGRRRLWPIVAGVLGAWVVAAVVLGAGGDDGDDPVAATTTSTTATPTTRSFEATSTTGILEGAPLLGRMTGWHLVVAPSEESPSTRLVDLDTGLVDLLDAGELFGPARPDGVFTLNQVAGVLWHPFPFDEATAVFLGPAADGGVFPVAGTDTAWLALGQSAAVNDARLVSLADGAPLASVELPVDSWVIGAVGEWLVVGAGGDTFRIGADGASRRISTGQPAGVLGDEVLVKSCDENLRCGTTAVDVATGATRAMPGIGEDETPFALGPVHPDGRLVALLGDPVRPSNDAVLLGPDGREPLLPDGVADDSVWGAAWSPDGSLLFVPGTHGVYVVDPFADGGPRQVATLQLRNTGGSRLAVVQPRSED